MKQNHITRRAFALSSIVNTTRLALPAALGLLALGSLATASVIPVELPPPDAKPPAKDKPVKVYILSGQSNMVGFGAVEPRLPQYGRIFLSADPSARVMVLPVGGAALRKHRVCHISVWLEEVKLPEFPTQSMAPKI